MMPPLPDSPVCDSSVSLPHGRGTDHRPRTPGRQLLLPPAGPSPPAARAQGLRALSPVATPPPSLSPTDEALTTAQGRQGARRQAPHRRPPGHRACTRTLLWRLQTRCAGFIGLSGAETYAVVEFFNHWFR